jgi:hypothetical protein
MLARLLFSLAVFVAWLTFQIYQLRGYSLQFGRVGATLSAIPIAFLLLLVVGNEISHRLGRRAKERSSPSVGPTMKLGLYRETCLLATLLERLGSESYLSEKELPPGVEIVTRRAILDRLNSLGLREGLEPWTLDLLLAPDGHWTHEQKRRAAGAWERFVVLHWTLGLSELRPLNDSPNYNLADARSLFQIKRPIGLSVRPSWDLRPAREEADNFFNRCWTELTARGALSGVDKDDVDQAILLRAEIADEGYLGDYLIGTMTVAEVDLATLWYCSIRAYRRWEATSRIIDVLTADVPLQGLRELTAEFFPQVPQSTEIVDPA